MLTTVTLTGADDGVDPAALVALSREFPFVEWGILFSPKRGGTPRYPSPEWVARLNATNGVERDAFAAHFCGGCTRDTLAGSDTWVADLPAVFDRVQLNGFEVSKADGLARLVDEYGAHHLPDFILQVRSEPEIDGAVDFAMRVGVGVILFDPSGGRGVEQARWPGAPCDVPIGYAGGINPGNVEDVLRAVVPLGAAWIDMESGVRVGDRFDLDLCRKVLTLARPFVSVSK